MRAIPLRVEILRWRQLTILSVLPEDKINCGKNVQDGGPNWWKWPIGSSKECNFYHRRLRASCRFFTRYLR
jgi:hypothetical protein